MTSPLRRPLPLEILDLIISKSSDSVLLAWCLTSKRSLAFAGPILVREVSISGERHVMTALQKLSPHRPRSNLLFPLSFSQTRRLTLHSLPDPQEFDKFCQEHKDSTFNLFLLNMNVARALDDGSSLATSTEQSYVAFYAPRLLSTLRPKIFVEEEGVLWNPAVTPEKTLPTLMPPPILQFYHLAHLQLHPWSLAYLVTLPEDHNHQPTSDLFRTHLAVLSMGRDRTLFVKQMVNLKECFVDLIKFKGEGEPVPVEVEEWKKEAEKKLDPPEEGCEEEEEAMAKLGWEELLELGEEKATEQIEMAARGVKLLKGWLDEPLEETLRCLEESESETE